MGKESLKIRTINAKAEGLTLPELCSLELSYFTLPDHPVQNIVSELNAFLDSFAPYYEIHQPLRPTPIPAGYQVDSTHPFVSWIQKHCKQTFGKNLPTAFGCSVADENILANCLNVPVLSLAPIGGSSHQAQEWVSKKSMHRLERLYCLLLDSANALD